MQRQSSDNKYWNTVVTGTVRHCATRAKLPCLALMLLLLFSSYVTAQSTSASINGTVTDTTGAVVAGADVTLRNTSTNVEQKVTTNGAGIFSIVNISPGTYLVHVSKSGFASAEQRDISLGVNQTATLNYRLAVGSTQQVVTVQGTVSIIQSSTAELGTVIGTQYVNNLPLNGRNFTQLLTLTPGVSPRSVGQNSGGGWPWGGGAIGTFTFPAVNGARNRSNMFLVDGVNDLAFLGNYNYAPIVDGIQEFKVQSHNDLAEFGQVAGGIVSVATKGGTNSLHGSLWEFLRNEQMDARGYFAPRRNPLRQNQFGATVGGPVFIPHLYDGRNHTFFFFAWEGFRQSKQAQSLVLTPTPQELSGDFSSLLTRGVQLYNPFTTRADPNHPGEFLRDPFPNNQISSYMSPAALLYAKTLFPKPSVSGVPGGNVFDTTPSHLSSNNFSGRIDQDFGLRDAIFGRISYASQLSSGSGGYPGSLSTIPIDAWNIALHETHSFGPRAILDAYFGRNLGTDVLRNSFTNAPADFVSQLINVGFSPNFISHFPLSGSKPEVPGISIPGYVTSQGDEFAVTQLANTYEFGADFTRIFGRHTMKVGASYSLNHLYAPGAQAEIATSSFQTSNLENPAGPSGKGTGDPMASFLLGVPTSANWRDHLSTYGGGGITGVYVQDQFQATPRLSLNFGLRYDLSIWPVFGSLTDKGGRTGYIGTMNFSNGTYVIAAQPPACSSTVGAPCIPGGALPEHVVVTPISNHSLHHTDYGDWQGRFGLAFRLSPTTAMRGGYSRFYDIWNALTQMSQNLTGAWPNLGSLDAETLNQTFPSASLGDPLNLGGGAVFQPAATPLHNANYYYDPNMKEPYSDQWNFGIDQQFGQNTTLSLTYVGSHSGRLDNGAITNTATYAAPGDAAAVALRRPYPYITATPYDQSIEDSNYNALYSRLEHRTSHGLTYLISYTWSKSIDTGCSGAFGVEGCEVQNPSNRRLDRSVSSYDLTNIFSGSAVYELPFGQGRMFSPANRVLSHLVGGWQVNAIAQMTSGNPYDVISHGDNANIGNNFVRANLVDSPTPEHRTLAEWINPSAFVIPPRYTFGTMGRNSLRADWYRDLDVSLFRDFRLGETAALTFRAEAFNATNSVVFAIPGHTLSTPTFGVVTSQSNSPRQLQVALKLAF